MRMDCAMNTFAGKAPSVTRRLSVAPMMEWTDRYCRAFHRAASRHTLLYTEMVTTGAVIHGDRDRLLGFDDAEHPVACQLGGSDPKDLAEAARIVASYGYDEVNLNVGCPSDRVQSGRFGACLMAEPQLVADCVAAMAGAVEIPVTVKSRIGIDDADSYEGLASFVDTVRQGGCASFTVHARKAILKGLSPKENREIPPLHYDYVYRLKADFPDLEICLNGGVQSLDEAEVHLAHIDGVMIGRAAYNTPSVLLGADRQIFAETSLPSDQSRHDVVRAYIPYIERQVAAGVPLIRMTRHILGIFNGLPGARAWRRYLSENAPRKGSGADTVHQALSLVPEGEAGRLSAG